MCEKVRSIKIKYPTLFRKHFPRAFPAIDFPRLRLLMDSLLEQRKDSLTLEFTTEELPDTAFAWLEPFEDLMEGMTPNEFTLKWDMEPQSQYPFAYMTYGLYPEARIALWRFIGAIQPNMEDLDAIRLTYHIDSCGELYIPVVDSPTLFLPLVVELCGTTFHIPSGQCASAVPGYAEFVEEHGTPHLTSVYSWAWGPNFTGEGDAIIPLSRKGGRLEFPKEE